MNAELIKQKISKAVEKINSLKEELQKKKSENEALKQEISGLLKANDELNNRIGQLEQELYSTKENNENTVKDIETKLNELNSLLGEEEVSMNYSDQEEPTPSIQEEFPMNNQTTEHTEHIPEESEEIDTSGLDKLLSEE